MRTPGEQEHRDRREVEQPAEGAVIRELVDAWHEQADAGQEHLIDDRGDEEPGNDGESDFHVASP